ncbi:transglycosylase SLT domain-containing protein [Oryzomicrobium sp.]|uniref:transglycosylase SLT domain-containing protein n=1 Tax=Oryzomicrobium sp. TaxID=1911578 RepID=UPI002FDF70F8
MPRVPTYDSFQVAPTNLPQARLDAPAMPDIAGRQMQQMGEAAQRLGSTIGQVANDVAQQANQLRVDDALNQAKEAALRLTYDKDSGFTNLKGINALERPDGKPLADEYGDNLKDQLSRIAGTLGNDTQRQAFAMHSNDILTSFRGQALQHEAGEFKTYGLSVAEGIQRTALRDIELNWNNPAAVDSAVERIRTETYRQAQLLGKSAEWQEAQARSMTSGAHKVALLTALEQNDPAYADAYLKKYSGQMDGNDILAVRGHITKEMDVRIGVGAASEVMRQMQPRIQIGEVERAFKILVGTESNNRQFGTDGKPLTSPKGAVGIAQVMPDTAPEAAKLAGLPWDENRYKTDPAYNRALGLAYFQKQLQDTGGDLAKSYAAYNAGPGRLAKAVKAAELAKNDPNFRGALYDGQGDPKDWRSHLPKETRDYVAKNMAAYEAGQGQPQRPTFQEIDDQLRADPRLADNPARYKIAREEASRLFTEQTAAIKQRDDDAVATAMRGVIQNGGRFSDLPASVRAAVPPKEVDNLLGFAQKISKGDDSTNTWLYNKLTSNPDALARMSDNEFFALRRELSEADFKHFSNERAKLTGAAPGGNGPGDINSQAIKQSLDARLRMLNIDPTPKDDGGSDASRIGAIRHFVDQYFIAAQREAGKKFTEDAEVAQHIDALFAHNVTFRGLFSNSSGTMLTMKAGDIPPTARDSIKAAYKRQGIDAPTDAQLLAAYWNMKVTRK